MVPGWICVLVNVQSTVCPNRRCAVKLAAARLIVVLRPRSGSTTSEHVMPVLTHPGTDDFGDGVVAGRQVGERLRIGTAAAVHQREGSEAPSDR